MTIQLQRKHVVGVRTDLPSCNIHSIHDNDSSTNRSSTTKPLIVYPCDNILVLQQQSCTQRFIETTKADNIIAAYDISSDDSLLALAENEPEASNDDTSSNHSCSSSSSSSSSSSLVTIYDLRTCFNATTRSTGSSAGSSNLVPRKKRVIRLGPEHTASGRIKHISFVHSTHILVLGNEPDYMLTLWPVDRATAAAAAASATASCSAMTLTPTKQSSKHPGGLLASVKLATPSGKAVYRVDASPKKEDAGNVIVCATGCGIVRFFRLTNNTFRPITVNLKQRKAQNYVTHQWLPDGKVVLGTDTAEILVMNNFCIEQVLDMRENCETITSIAECPRGFVAGSDNGKIHLFESAPEGAEADGINYQCVSSFCLADFDSNLKITSIAVTSTKDGASGALCATSENQIIQVPLHRNNPKDDDLNQIVSVPSFYVHGQEDDSTSSTTEIDISADTCSWRPLIAVTSSPANVDVADARGMVRIYNYHSKIIEGIRRFEGRPISICFHPSSFHLVVCTESKIVVCDVVRNIAHGRPTSSSRIGSTMDDKEEGKGTSPPGYLTSIVVTGEIEMTTPNICVYSNGGQYLAVCNGPLVHIFNDDLTAEICTLRGHSSRITAVRWQSGDQRISTIGEDGCLCIWTVPHGRQVLRRVNALSSYHTGAVNATLTRALVCTKDSILKMELQESPPSEVTVRNARCCNTLEMSLCGRMMIGSDKSKPSDLNVALLDDDSSSDGNPCRECTIASGLNGICSLKYHNSDGLLFVLGDKGTMHTFDVHAEGMHSPKREDISTVASAHTTSSSIDDNTTGTHTVLSEETLVSSSELATNQGIIKSKESQLASILQSNTADLVRMDECRREAIDEIYQQRKLSKENYNCKLKQISEEKHRQLSNHEDSLCKARKEHQVKMKEIEEDAEKKIKMELDRIAQVREENEKELSDWEKQKHQISEEEATTMKTLTEDYQAKLKAEIDHQSKLAQQQTDIVARHNALKQSLELEADNEMAAIMTKNEIALSLDTKATLQLREQNNIQTKQLNVLLSDLDEQKETIDSLSDREMEVMASIEASNRNISRSQEELKDNDNITAEKEQHMLAMNNECEALQDQKEALSRDADVLNEDLNVLKRNIDEKREAKALLESDLKLSRQSFDSAQIAIRNLKAKASSVERELLQQEQRKTETASIIGQLENEIRNVAREKDDPSALKAKLLPLFGKYLSAEGDATSVLNDKNSRSRDTSGTNSSGKEGKTKASESERREINLRKKLETVNGVILKNEEKHKRDMFKLKSQQRILQSNIAESSRSSAVPVLTKENISSQTNSTSCNIDSPGSPGAS